MLLSGCTLFDPVNYWIQPELQPTVDRFYQEGIERGYKPSRENCLARLEKGVKKKYGSNGVTSFEQGGIMANPQIYVRIDEDYFYTADSVRVACTIIHELGHAILRRDHVAGHSFMAEGTGLYYELTEEKVEELFDELFGNR